MVKFPEHISSGALLHGGWYTKPSEVEADRAIFDLSQLSSWVNLSGLETEYPQLDGGRDDPFVVITGSDLPAFTITHENAVVELRQVLRHTGDHELATGVEQSWRLVIKIEPMGELDRFTDVAIDIRALVTIGAGKTADITRAVLQHPQLHEHILDGTPVPALRGSAALIGDIWLCVDVSALEGASLRRDRRRPQTLREEECQV